MNGGVLNPASQIEVGLMEIYVSLSDLLFVILPTEEGIISFELNYSVKRA